MPSPLDRDAAGLHRLRNLRVFLSYCHDDVAAATEIYDGLTRAGLRVVRDVEALANGDDWRIEVGRHLKRCRVVLALCSPGFNASAPCDWEIATARGLGKLIIPISLDDAPAPASLSRRIRLSYRMGDVGTAEFGAALSAALVKGGAMGPSPERFVAGESPFPGLRPFDDDRAGVYFGREERLGEAMELVVGILDDPRAERRFVVVTGGSGVGKSSFVRAGLVPRLRRDGQRRFVLPAVRAGGGIGALGAVLAEHVEAPPDEITRCLEHDPASSNPLGRLLQATGGDDDPPAVVIVIDQGEELFSEVPPPSSVDPGERAEPERDAGSARLLDVLMAATQMGSDGGPPAPEHASVPPVLVIATVRSDFEVRLSEELMQRIAGSGSLRSIDAVRAVVQLLPLSTAEIVSVVDDMADPAQFDLEGLPLDRQFSSVPRGSELPLVSFALRRAWNRGFTRNGRRVLTLTAATMTDAVEEIAEAAFDCCIRSGMAESAVESLLIRSVDLRGRHDAERWVRCPFTAEPSEMFAVEQFVTAGLIVATGDGFELAHEAIVSAWPRLETLVETTRSRRRVELLVRERHRVWASRRSPGSLSRRIGNLRRGTDLLVGAQLAVAREMSRDPQFRVTAGERRYIAKSVRRSRRVVTTLAIGVVALTIAAVVAVGKSAESDRQAAAAVAVALGETAAAESSTNPALAMVVAAQSLEHQDPPPAGVVEALARARVAFESRTLQPYRAPFEGAERTISQLDMVAGSPMVVATSPEHRPRAWDLGGAEPTSRPLGVDESETTDVVSAVLGPGAATMTTVSSSGLVTEWETATGRRTGSVQTSADVESVRSSADGSSVVANRRTDLLAWPTGRPQDATPLSLARAVAPGSPTPMISDVVHVGAGQRIVASSGGSLWIRDDPSVPTLRELPVDPDVALGKVAASPSSELVAVEGGRSVRVVDVSTGQEHERIDLPADDGDLTAMAFSPDGVWLAVGVERSIRLYHVDTTRERVAVRFDGEVATIGRSIVRAMVFDTATAMLVTAGNDSTIQRWLVRPPSRLEFDGVVTGVRVDGPRWVVGTTTELTSYSSTGGVPVAEWVVEGAVSSLDLDTDSGAIASTGPQATGVVTVRNPAGAVVASVTTGGDVRALRLAPGGGRLATADRDGSVTMWRLDDHSVVWRLAPRGLGSADAVRAIAFDPSGDAIVIGDGDGRLDRIDAVSSTPRRTELHDLTGPINAIAFSPDGRYLAAASSGLTVWLSDRTTGESHDLAGHTGQAMSVAFDSAGARVAAGDDTGTVRTWRTGDRSSAGPPVAAHGDQVRDVAFGADDELLAASGSSLDYWDSLLSADRACDLGADYVTVEQALALVRSAAKDDRTLWCRLRR